MTLYDELRAALNQQADMTNAPRPDVDGLVRGGQLRRRRRNMVRIGVVAAAAVLVGGGAYGVTQIDSGDPGTDPGIADQTTQPTETSESAPTTSALPDRDRAPVEPGTYRIFVDYDADGTTAIEADMTIAGRGWESGDYLVISDAETWAGFGMYRPLALTDGSGCSGDWQRRDAAETPQGLARQFARLPQSTVVQPPTPTEAFGHDALHLRLRIDDSCPSDQVYRVAETSKGYRGISYSNVPTEVVIDFWVVDLDGTAVVVDLWHQGDASTELVDRATRARDSISFVTPE
jgi:hypothetical protein